MVPYDKIDPELRSLVRELNLTRCVQTIGCCIGHGTNPVADIIFDVIEPRAWHSLMNDLLWVGRELPKANMDIYQWHRLTPEGTLIVDWVLRIEAHPRSQSSNVAEDLRVLQVKNEAILATILTVKEWQSRSSANTVALTGEIHRCSTHNCQTLAYGPQTTCQG